MTTRGQDDTTAAWLACAECQAPLDATQRYCVSCGARHAQADNPAARYFGSLAQQRRRPLAPPAPRRGVGIGLAAALALLPLAVGGGVLVGRSGHGGDAELLQALKSQKPTVVNVGGGGGALGTTSSTTGGGSSASAGDTNEVGGGTSGDTPNAIVATGVGGVAHSVLHHQATAKSRAQDKQAVRNITKQTGQGYIKAQKTLPDVVDVQSDPGAGSQAPTGAGD